MKKIFVWMMIMVLTSGLFVGCGKEQAKGPDISVELDLESPELDLDVEPYEAPDNSAQLELKDTPSIEIETYEAPEHSMDLELEDVEIDLDIETYVIQDNVQGAELNDIPQNELENIVEKKENMMNALIKAFKGAGIKVTMDKVSGELTLDSAVLFGGDSAVLSEEGKTFLSKFIKAYASVICSDEYEGFVSKVLVEGHTAPVAGSTYESGLPLSEERAKTVKKYCLSKKAGLGEKESDTLAKIMEDVGLSNSEPVKDDQGNVDMAASRRVAFRFFINVD